MGTYKTNIGNIVAGATEGIILQQVNAQGVMGSGVAGVIRAWWPQVFDEYAKVVGPAYTQLESGRLLLGTVIPVKVSPKLWVVNIVGQQFFGKDPSLRPGGRYTSYDALANGLQEVRKFAKANQLTTIHYPLIGCGLGGGKWPIVSSIIDTELESFDRNLWVLSQTDLPQ